MHLKHLKKVWNVLDDGGIEICECSISILSSTLGNKRNITDLIPF